MSIKSYFCYHGFASLFRRRFSAQVFFSFDIACASCFALTGSTMAAQVFNLEQARQFAEDNAKTFTAKESRVQANIALKLFRKAFTNEFGVAAIGGIKLTHNRTLVVPTWKAAGKGQLGDFDWEDQCPVNGT